MKTVIQSLVLLTIGAVGMAEIPVVPSRASAVKLRSPRSRAAVPRAAHSAQVPGRRATPTDPATPAPGLYAAVPYSAIVVIPAPMDPKFVVPTGDAGERFDQAAIVEAPPIQLVPLRR